MLPFEDNLPFETLPFEEDVSEFDKMKKYGGKVLNSARGVAETGASLVAGIPSQIAGGLAGLSQFAAGQGLEKAANTVEDVQRSNFGLGAFEPQTDVGKKGAQNLQALLAAPGEYAGDVGAFIGKQLGNEELGRLSGKLPTDVLMNFLPLHGVGKAFKGSAEAIANKIGKEALPTEKPNVAETLKKFEEPVKTVEEPVRSMENAIQQELPFETSVETIARKQAEVSPQRDLFVEEQKLADKFDPYQENLNKQALQDKLDLERMGQEDMFRQQKDEAFAQRDKQLAEEARMAAEDQRATQLEQQYDPRLGRERGAINMDAMSEAYNKVKDLVGGVKLVYFGDSRNPKITAFDEAGKAIGNLELSTDKFGEPKASDNMQGMWVESHAKDLAQEMYKFASEQGHDIVPSQAQTPAGKAMWDKFEKQGLSTNGKIPAAEVPLAKGFGKQQAGKIDFEAIGNALSRAIGKPLNDLAKVDISRAAGKSVDEYAASIPGMGKAVEHIIPRPESAESIVAKAMQGADLPNIFKDIASGPEMTGWKYRNAAVSGVSKWFQWADKKADSANKLFVKPVEKALSSLDAKSQSNLAEALKAEMFRKEQFTDAQLAEALSPKELAAYKQLRESFNTVYDLQVAQLQKLGREIPTKGEAYLASIRNGDYHVNVKNADGRVLFHTQARSMREAKSAKAWIEKNVPGASKYTVGVRKPNVMQGVPRDILGGFQELLKLVDEDSDAGLAVQQAIRKAQEEAGYNAIGQKNRFLEKQNIRGFEGDMPWLGEKENASRLLQSQIDYLNSSYKWTYLQDALANVKDVLANQDFVNAKPNTASYIKEVVRQHLGLQENFVRGLEDYTMHSIGSSRAELSKITGKLSKLTSLQQLGASIGYMIATPLTALQSVGVHMREGTLSLPALSKSLYDFTAGLVNNGLHESGIKGQLPMTELGKEALKYAEDNDIIAKNMFGDLEAVNRNKNVSSVLSKYEITVTLPEKIQRLSTFMSFVHGLKETGKHTNMYDLFQEAETLTNIAATNFKEHPMFVDKLGTIGNMGFKYKAPILNYYHQLHAYARDAAQGNIKPLATMLGMTVALGGVLNLPLVNEADIGWNKFKDLIAAHKPEVYNDIKDFDVKDFIRQHVGEAAANGTVQQVLGAQMSQRFGTDITNDSMLGNLPVANTIGNIAQSAMDVSKGNLAQAAWRQAPQSLRGNMETRMDQFKTVKQGENQGYRKPSDAATAATQIVRTPEDEAFRKLGLRSSNEARNTETYFKNQQEQQRVTAAMDGTMKKLFSNIIDKKGDKAETYARAWLQLNPNSDAFNRGFDNAVKAYSFSPEQRELMKANTIATIMKAKRLMDARAAGR